MTHRVIALLFIATLASAEPAKLSETGLYSDIRAKTVSAGIDPFSPQYPLWTDGAKKARWIRIPQGEKIDTRDMDRWIFPVGTRFWKEFAYDRRIETRYMEKSSSGAWIFASYEWNADESEAVRVSDGGKKDVHPTGPTTSHDIPSLTQCKFCHSRGGDPVEGFDALQLSDDRDPLAPHGSALPEGAVTFGSLESRGLLSSVPSSLLASPPRIHARTPEARAALGFLHGNCGGCHNPEGRAAGTGQFTRHEMGALSEGDEPGYSTTVNQETSRFQIPGQSVSYRIRPGDRAASAVHYRLSVSGKGQMPPVGRDLVDKEALELIERWIEQLAD